MSGKVGSFPEKGGAMKEYHKIHTIFKRDMSAPGRQKPLIEGEWSKPEFEYLANCEWELTEKVDGTNIRVMWDGKGLAFGGKTERMQMPPHLGDALYEQFWPMCGTLTEKFPEGVCFYGEGYGPKIQKGAKYRDTPGFVMFDIRIGPWWLKSEDVRAMGKDLGIDVVPVICPNASLLEAVEAVRGHNPSHWGAFQAEGIVARPAVDLKARSGERIIAKIKSCDFGQE
jgi:hypothetical protein